MCYRAKTAVGGRLRIVLDLSQEPYFGMLCRSARRWKNHLRQNTAAMPAHTANPAMLATLTAELVVAYVSSNKIPADAIPGLIESVYRFLQKIGEDSEGKRKFSLRAPATARSPKWRAGRGWLPRNPTEAMNGIVLPTEIARHYRQRKAPGRRRRR
jgi:hypothetical protein